MPDSPAYRWNAGAGRYIGPDGTFVSTATVRGAVDAVIAGVKGELFLLGQAVAAGTLTVPEWQNAVAATLRALHTACAVAAAGGWAQMTPADWGRLGAATRTEYGYLAAFAAEVAGGTLTPAQIARRTASYADAGRGTFERQGLITVRGSTLTQEANELGEADHCEDCLAATAAGWVPIGTLTRPGTRKCRGHCQCRMKYR